MNLRLLQNTVRTPTSPVAAMLATALVAACGVQRSGLGGLDASRPDAARRDAGLVCAEGTVDVNGDPDDGCECTLSAVEGERCNGIDDDCDGVTDEDVAGDPRLGGSCDGDDEDLCTDGVVECVDGAPTCVDARDPEHVEVCDDAAVDEDCDGDRNEGCSCTPGSDPLRCGPESEMGLCVFGTQRCVDGSWGACEGAVLPAPETCDNRDEDCDGRVDDGVSRSCANRCGTPGLEVCVAGTFGACDAPPEPAEVCNGADDDCDGATDEGLTRSCTNACGQVGTETCVAGSYVGCTAPPEPAETCDNMDNDCDGSTDEGLTRSCMNACGQTGTETCTAGSYGGCTAPPEPAETCDNVDNDCDGSTDEGLTRSCTNPCGATGTETCVSGVWQGCTAISGSGTEACNAADDDCDGAVDEGADCGDCTVRADPSDSTHTYLFCTTVRSRDEAAANCASHGYHLADLETEVEHAAVWAAAQGVRANQNWLFGIHYDGADMQWEWTDGRAAHPSDPAGHDGWAAGEPSADTCGFLWWRRGWSDSTSRGGWKAAEDCSARRLSVCEAGD